MIAFVLPVRTTNPLNLQFGASKTAGMIRARARAAQRSLAREFTIAALRKASVHPADLVPVDVLLTRLSAGHMDDDGLAASQKGVRDGIAEALGVDNGSRLIRFRYVQERAKRGVFGVRVEIEKRQAA